MIISRLFRVIMRNASDMICRENQTHILCPITHPPEDRVFCEIMWKKYGRARHVTAHAHCMVYRGADKSLAQPTSRCIFVGENISFDASLFIYINSTNIPPIIIINRMSGVLIIP